MEDQPAGMLANVLKGLRGRGLQGGASHLKFKFVDFVFLAVALSTCQAQEMQKQVSAVSRQEMLAALEDRNVAACGRQDISGRV